MATIVLTAKQQAELGQRSMPLDILCGRLRRQALEEQQYDETYGFYECDTCDNKWGYAEDDPDYAEAKDYPAIMEQIYEVDPAYWAKIQEGRTE